MTRGKIIYINHEFQVYTTFEFNGDMYPQRYGEDVLAGFKNGLFQNSSGYELDENSNLLDFSTGSKRRQLRCFKRNTVL